MEVSNISAATEIGLSKLSKVLDLVPVTECSWSDSTMWLHLLYALHYMGTNYERVVQVNPENGLTWKGASTKTLNRASLGGDELIHDILLVGAGTEFYVFHLKGEAVQRNILACLRSS